MFSELESQLYSLSWSRGLGTELFSQAKIFVLLLYHSRAQVYKFNANGSQTGDPIQGKRRGCSNNPSYFHALETSNVLTYCRVSYMVS